MHAPPVTPELLLRAYANGLFPMAERRDDPSLYWVSPEMRGIFPLDGFHVPKRLARTVRSDEFTVTADACFGRVMQECAAPAPGREESWINDTILELYTALYATGHAHSIECWRNGELAGGLYGVSLNGAFFGESMFSKLTGASKVALVHLVARLKCGGFTLLDTQFLTPHLARFGAVEIPREDYLKRLAAALNAPAYWPASSGSAGRLSPAPASGDTGTTGVAVADGGFTGALVMHLIAQTS
jgi:leucyl/phenylalanyl-tRNA---protein transferase